MSARSIETLTSDDAAAARDFGNGLLAVLLKFRPRLRRQRELFHTLAAAALAMRLDALDYQTVLDLAIESCLLRSRQRAIERLRRRLGKRYARATGRSFDELLGVVVVTPRLGVFTEGKRDEFREAAVEGARVGPERQAAAQAAERVEAS